jgi:hypothetical protein
MQVRTERAWWIAAALVAAVTACDIPTAPPRFETTFVVPGETVTVPVTSQNASASATYDLTDTADLVGRSRGGTLIVDVGNAAGATGTVLVRIAAGGVSVDGTVDLSAGSDQRIPVSRNDLAALLGRELTITATGRLCPQSGCSALTLPPFPTVTFDTRLELVLELGGES